jgi:WD40 repeat protein
MRILQAKAKRPLDLLAMGAGGSVAAASSAFGATGNVDVWDAATGKLRHTQRGGGHMLSLAFHPDGNQLFFTWTGGGVVAINVAERDAAFFSEDSRMPREVALGGTKPLLLVTESGERAGGLECWKLSEAVNEQLWEVKREPFTWFFTPAFSGDCVRVALSRHKMHRDNPENAVEVRDAATGKVTAAIEFGGANPLEEIAFSADGSQVIARSSGRTVNVFDAATGQPAGELLHPGRPFVTGMAVHPNGALACSRTNGTVCLWDVDNRKLLRTLDWKLGKLVSVAFAPDGSLGAAGTEDGQVVVWDVDE